MSPATRFTTKHVEKLLVRDPATPHCTVPFERLASRPTASFPGGSRFGGDAEALFNCGPKTISFGQSRYFIECSGNTLTEWAKPTEATVQKSHGLLSNSKRTGVAFSTLAREIGIGDSAKWGSDAATRRQDAVRCNPCLRSERRGDSAREMMSASTPAAGVRGKHECQMVAQLKVGDGPSEVGTPTTTDDYGFANALPERQR